MSSPIAFALAPARQGLLLPRNSQKPCPNVDALVLFPPESGDAAASPASNDNESGGLPRRLADDGSNRRRCSAGIGRHELRLAQWQVCPCHVRRARSPPLSDSTPAKLAALPNSEAGEALRDQHRPRQPTASQTSSFCQRCEYPWSRHLGRTFLKLQDERRGARGKSNELCGLWVKAPCPGEYPTLDRMRINGRSLREYGLRPSLPPSWLGPFSLRPGDSVSLEPPIDGITIHGDPERQKPMEFEVVAHRNGRLVPMPASYNYSPEVSRNVDSVNEQALGLRQPLDQDANLFHMEASLSGEYSAQSSESTTSPLRTQLPEQNKLLPHPEALQDRRSLPKSVDSLELPRSPDETEPAIDASANIMNDKRNDVSASLVDSDVETGKNELLTAKEHLFHPPETHTNADVARSPSLYFVKCNRYWDMHDKSTRAKAMERASVRGAIVLDKFDRQNLPTHLIVDRNFRIEDFHLLNEDLKFHNVQEMQRFLKAHNTVIARLNWVMKDVHTPFGLRLREDEMYHLPAQDGTAHKRPTEAPNESQQKRIKENSIDSQSEDPVNKDLIHVFTELSHFYRESPVDEQDAWRAFTFSRAASVIRNLTFGITSETLQELRRQKGLKDSCISIAQEYMLTRRCERLEMLRADKYRISLRAFTGIWGVGPKKAKELINMGYTNIAELRDATECGILKWLRNEYLGLKYYEDINDEMSRREAKMIVDLVTSAAHSDELCPTASVEVQGSYRRGKETCGDVDIIITDSSWADAVPPTFLGRLVDKLHEDSFVLHHLTLIPGMNPLTFETLDSSELEYIRPAANPKADKRSERLRDKRSYTWFGICQSPIYPNKVRRVDIKCYPFADHIYAWLYFTGNGHFNRAMRFWTKKQKEEPRYHLDDHGLWELNAKGKLFVDEYGHQKRASTKDGDIFVPQTERDVFDFLKLAWKEPHERDGFGALRTRDDDKVCDIPMSFADVLSDSKEHFWVE